MSRPREPPRNTLTWTLVAGAVGLGSSTLFSSLLRLEPAAFVLAHGLVTAGFAAGYASGTGVTPASQLRHRRLAGFLGGLILGVILIRSVAMQPASTAPRGRSLAGALAWYGAAYGVADAVLLNVIPVMAARREIGRFRHGIVALAGSLFVTALYHLGFAEFRGAALFQPLLGNAIITGGYLATGSPLTPILGHVIMHGAAVMHGMETTVQLPPHY